MAANKGTHTCPSSELISIIRSSHCNLHDNKTQTGRGKILLVEDIPIIQKANKALLESLNYTVSVAANGLDAVHKCGNYYDLIFMDLDLPDISGITACKMIRKKENHSKTPIIALTASEKSREFECQKAGMNGFAIKPLMPDALRCLLARWLPEFA